MWFGLQPEATVQERDNSNNSRQRSTCQEIANGSVTVNANNYSYYGFTILPGARDASVEGHFSAVGGSGNDIEVYVFSEDDFANWKNHHQSRVFYQSGKVTQGHINAQLGSAPGTYYLVLNNQFSLLAPKPCN